MAAREKTALEQLADAAYPSAQDLASRFAVHNSDNLRSDDELAAILANPGFGVDFADHMAHATWTKAEGWHNHVVEPYGALALEPGASVLHYGQEVFEGLKAYRHEDGSIWTFRPAYNAARLNVSSSRMAIPEFPIEDFLASVAALVRTDARWVPSTPGSSLYLRPFIFASEAFLGVRAASRFEYLVMASPSGPYFTGGLTPINVWVEKDFHRAGPGGTGDAKTGGNYAASLLPKLAAHDAGYDEVLFLDAKTNTNLDELGGMNVFVVLKDGSVRTPKLTGNILPGCTRSSIIELLADDGVDVSETTIELAWLLDAIATGEVTEMFACGTAAVVTPIGTLTGKDFKVELAGGEFTKYVHDELTGIQFGKRPDRFGWMYKLSE